MNLDHVLLIGPPGSGKTAWARAQAKCTELARECEPDMFYTYLAAGLVDRDRMTPTAISPPFRAPHHTVSLAGLQGTVQRGYQWRPGEFSLAHGGILFLDDLPEFRAQAFEALRVTMHQGAVMLPGSHTRYPGKFRLIASANPCPCGWYGYSERRCQCTDEAKAAYLGRIPSWLRDSLRVIRPEQYKADGCAGAE